MRVCVECESFKWLPLPAKWSEVDRMLTSLKIWSATRGGLWAADSWGRDSQNPTWRENKDTLQLRQGSAITIEATEWRGEKVSSCEKLDALFVKKILSLVCLLHWITNLLSIWSLKEKPKGITRRPGDKIINRFRIYHNHERTSVFQCWRYKGAVMG